MSRSWAALGLFVAIGFPVVLWWWLFGTHTQFSPEFSEERFRRLHVRQPRAEVLQALGEPLRILSEQQPEQWCYPQPGNGALYVASNPSSLLDVTGGDWCVSFGEDGLVERDFRESLGSLNRDQVRVRLGPPQNVWPKGLHERLVYSEPARPRANWEWREVVLREGEVYYLVSNPVGAW